MTESSTRFRLYAEDVSRAAFESFKAGAAGAEAQLTELQRELAATSSNFAEFQTKLAGAAKFTKDLNFKVESIGKTNADLLAMQAAQLGVAGTAAPMIARLREVEAANKSGSMSAAMHVNALRQVPMQVTDIVTSLASGQRPMMVLMQQGGQLKDTFGGVGSAAKALVGYVLSLVNPFTVAASAVGALGFAWLQGSSEGREFQNAATMSGNAAGMSASQYAMLRDNLSGIAGTKGKAAEVLTEIAGSAKLAGANVRSIAETATLMERATGQAISKTVEQFEQLRKAPLEASVKLNEQYNYLTASVYRQIKALDDQGRTVEAANLAEQTYSDAMKTRAQQVITNAGLMEKAWRGIGGVAKSAWDAMLGIGREMSPAEKLASAAADVARIQAQLAGVGAFASTGGGAAVGGASAARRATLEHELAAALQRQAYAQETVRLEQRSAEAKAEQVRLTQAAVGWEKIVTEYADKNVKFKLEEQRIRAAGIADGRTEAEIAKQLAAARERVFGGGSKAAKEAENEKRLLAELAGLSADFAKEWSRLSTMFGKGAISLEQLTAAQAALLAQQPFFKKNQKEIDEASKATLAIWKEEERVIQELIASRNGQFEVEKKALKSAEDQLAAIEFEVSTMGMSNEQRKIAIALRDLERSGLDKSTEAYKRLAEAIPQAVAQREAMQAHLRMWESVDRTAHDTFVSIFDSGKSTFDRLTDTLKNGLLDLLYQMTVRKWMISIGSSVAMSGSALASSSMGTAAGGGMGSFLTGAGTSALGNFAGSLGSELISGTLAANIGAGMAGVGGSFASTVGAGLATDAMGATVAANSAAATLGAGSTIGTALAAIPVWGWAAMAAMAVAALAKGGETRVGGQYSGTSLIDSPSGGPINNEATATAIAATIGQTNALLKGLGSSASVSLFRSGLEQSEKGKGFAYARGTLSTGQQFGRWDVDGYMQNRGSMTAEQAAARFGEELKQATLQALQAANVPGQLGDYLRSLGDIERLSGGALDAALGRLQKALSEKQTLEDRHFELTHTALEVQTRDRQRERDALDESNRALYDQIAALQDARLASEAYSAQLRESLTSNLNAAYQDLLDARTAESDALKTTIGNLESSASRFRTFATDIRTFRDSLLLGDLSPLTPGQRYAESRRLAEETYSRALTGDQDAMAQIPQVARDFLQASQVYNASSDAYLRDFTTVQTYLAIGAAKADEAASWAQTQTTILSAQLSALGTINASVLTVAQAMAGLRTAGAAAIGSGIQPSDDMLRAYLTTAVSAGSYMDAYTALQASGRTMAQGDELLGYGAGTIAQWARGVGVATFASGGIHAGGARLVGEHGPELEVTGPSRIFNAEQTSLMLGGDNGGLLREMLRELQVLRAESQQQRAELTALRNDHRQGVISRNEATLHGAQLVAEAAATGPSKAEWNRQRYEESLLIPRRR